LRYLRAFIVVPFYLDIEYSILEIQLLTPVFRSPISS
jgi:hypothetical protein